VQQFTRPIKNSQSTYVQAEIGLHSYTVGNKLTVSVIWASDSQASQAIRPAGLQDTCPEKKSKC